ncbi:hypothetical protein ACFFMN_23565 [Planobispora siamensis]|uniref:Uncharacterized protein n=1 Tax=Planobispora siamensis TaxID=936338 RepID=A0A8J3WMU4_9ACTN|nr:hypothetical protein [Planobispora siamensis]GIH95343.1 hypothetical protein Psi01_59730 [Planobispora siamensis]
MSVEQHVQGIVHNAITGALRKQDRWLPLTVRMALTESALGVLREAGYVIVPAAPEEPSASPGVSDHTDTSTAPSADHAEIGRLRALIDTYEHPDATKTVNAWRDYAKHWRDRAECSEPGAALALLRREAARIRVESAGDPLVGWALDRMLAAIPANAENGAASKVTIPADLYDRLISIAAYVSRGRGYVGVEPYPDATARATLGALPAPSTGDTPEATCG